MPFLLGLGMILLLITGRMPKINGSNIIEFPEALCFMAAGVFEVCMQLGLIPSNTRYRKLMQMTSVPVAITDRSGKVIYRSDAAQELTREQFRLPDKTRIGEHTLLRRMEIPGGFGFWQSNVREIDAVNEALAEVKERLSEETELIRLKNELKEKQTKIEQRTLVYDTIAGHTRRQSFAITRIAREALSSSDADLRDKC